MERAVAIKKLTKLLGPKLGYRVNPKAGDHNDREEARTKLKEVSSERAALGKRLLQRQHDLLKADEEYQCLLAANKEIDKTYSSLQAASNHYRFTAGICNDLFFMIKAQGDSWEEVIAKIEKDKKYG